MAEVSPQVFFIGNFNQLAMDMLLTYKIPFTHLDDDKYTLAGIEELNFYDAVVFDSYFLSNETIKNIANQHFMSILIDDECLLNYSGVDVVINFRFDAELLYQYNSKNQFLGSDYFVVKPELVELRRQNRSRNYDSVSNILLFFGGSFSDEKFLSELIEHLNDEAPGVSIQLISSYPLQNDKLNYTLIKPSYNIEDYLSTADILINGGGLVKYEATFALVPTASVSTTQLQYEDSLVLEKLGLHQNAGRVDLTNRVETDKAIDELVLNNALRKKLVENCKSLFSDNPTKNLIDKLNTMVDERKD